MHWYDGRIKKMTYIILVTDLDNYKIVEFKSSGDLEIVETYEDKAEAQKAFNTNQSKLITLEPWIINAVYDAIYALAWPKAYIKKD
jgi:hypothetical protein